MTELGMSCGDIDKDLELKTRRCVEYLKLLFPLHFASKDGGAICYDVGDNGYEIVLDKEDGVVNRIRIQNTIMSGAPINVIRDLKCSMYSQSLSEYIDFSGLNRSDKYTIPGYNPPITAD